MAKKYLLLALLLGSPLALGEVADAPDADSFKRPLEILKFTPALNEGVFDKSTYQTIDVYDPFEAVNRHIYQFNYHADQYVMLPLVRGYKYVTPEVARDGVSNFFSNLDDVGNLLNSLLQLKGEQSMRITARLLFNTTFGVLGLWDPASKMGLPKEKEDFGVTLGHYGVAEGPYIMLPLLGPSNLRDTTGLVTDTLAENSIDFLNVPTESSRHPELMLLDGVNTRYTTPFEYGQLDTPFEYLKVRFLYTEMRRLKINVND
ncbi:MlaA family lipoprotein [Pseudomonas sp. N040]|uniref:MlaA family lipoprotein n=1 Tax=Pseudomonas sp. N040 TaxID=2785325 RepID=UPI0018A25473|nr:VacJ family lipoprotein [Pseudomonas sp. N040]MBF7731456.1 VacJ family lipoprotein [Pseudomonas sp. N040]MBW7015100.1 VacJ family lipoprotein [Pseudomonas sp. N040]